MNAYADPAFDQNGISCERCHGPGSLHIEGKGRMVNPAKLAPARRDAVCAQCHLTGQSRVVRAGRQLDRLSPGRRVVRFRRSHRAQRSRAEFQVNSHVEKLAESGCKRAAGDRLWCGTCHDPPRAAARLRTRWRTFAPNVSLATRRLDVHRGFDCAGCHMPKNPAADAGHGVFTDHTIPRNPARPASRARAPSAASWNLRGWSPPMREIANWAWPMRKPASAPATAGNRRRPSVCCTAASQDAEVQVRLADLQERAGNPARAVELYRAALRQDPNAVVALVNLGRLYGSAGHLDEAITLWREALKRNPCLS